MAKIMDNRQLDALVAQAMGLQPCSDPIGRCDGAKTDPPQCWGTPDKHGVVEGSYLPRVSTDIAEAMGLVEELRRGTSIERDDGFHKVELIRTVVGWTCILSKDLAYWYGSSDLLATAICLAYLKAKGVEVGE